MPFSMVPITAGKVFASNLTTEYPLSLCYIASLDADAIWRLYYRMPPSLPTGTGKLLIHAQANATTGDAKINVKWKSYAATEVPAAASLNAETVSTITFATTAYRLTELKVTLDADTLVGGELVMLDMTGETSSWTLAATLGILPPPIIWE